VGIEDWRDLQRDIRDALDAVVAAGLHQVRAPEPVKAR